MSTIPLPLYVAFFFFLGGALLLNLHHRYQNKQRALPARDQYLAAHHLTGPICHVCGSDRLAESGLTHGEDERRIFTCLGCKEMLFQDRRAATGDEDSAWRRTFRFRLASQRIRSCVSMAEVEQVFFNAPLLLLDDEKHSQQEARHHALGRTDEGRLLHLTFTLRKADSLIRVISARDMHRKERTNYEQAD